MRPIKSVLLVFYVIATLLGTNSPAVAGLFGPSNYEECVIEGLKEAKTEFGAKMITSICSDKFPVRDPAKAGGDASLLTDTECHVVYRGGKTELGRASKKTHLTLVYSYYDYMQIHIAVPREIASRLNLEKELRVTSEQDDMSSSAKQFESKVVWSAKATCNLP